MALKEARGLREQLSAPQVEALVGFRRLIDSQGGQISIYGDGSRHQREAYAYEFEQTFGSAVTQLREAGVDSMLWRDETVRSLELMYSREDPRRGKIPHIARVFVKDLAKLNR